MRCKKWWTCDDFCMQSCIFDDSRECFEIATEATQTSDLLWSTETAGYKAPTMGEAMKVYDIVWHLVNGYNEYVSTGKSPQALELWEELQELIPDAL